MEKKKNSYASLMIPMEAQNRYRKNISLEVSQIVENERNVYPITDVEELADSIYRTGLTHPLSTKAIGDGKYLIISGHRRFSAIKHLIEQGLLQSDYEIPSTLVDAEEDDTITTIRLHEANMQTRDLKNLTPEEKELIVSDYLNLLEEAKEKGIKINGKEIKGRKRELVAERFNISEATAGRIISNMKDKDAEPKPKKEKTSEDKGKALVKQLKKTYEFLYDFKDEIEDDTLEEIRTYISDIESII